MRAMSMVLIVVNLLLGATVAVSSRSQDGSADWRRDCCRGAGPDAYCCLDCCWWTSNCKTDIDCRTP